MKLSKEGLREVLQELSLEEFRQVPEEGQIDHCFSPALEEGIRAIDRKSGNVLWRVWRSPMKRAAAIALMAVLALTGTVCAVPAIREAAFSMILGEDERGFWLTLDPEAVSKASPIIEECMIPSYEPEGFELVRKEVNDGVVQLLWEDGSDGCIWYTQFAGIPGITVNAEGAQQSTRIVGGYQVRIISSEERRQFVALWTDQRYIYKVNISSVDVDPDQTLEKLLTSLTPEPRAE